MTFDVQEFRKGFPQLEIKVGLQNLIYFDSGASSLKHASVSDRINRYNRFEVANVHRGAHQISRSGTDEYERAREKVQKFINAQEPAEIIFTRGTTEGINLLASVLQSRIHEQDEILISPFEHHSNIVPWQVLCEKTQAQLKVIPFDMSKGVKYEDFLSSLSPKTKVLSILYYSNSFGNKLPIEKILKECRQRNIITIVDAAQAPLSVRLDVQKLDCDFLVFSGHKMFGPYGIGILYGKAHWLEQLPPYQTGGSMIDRVSFEKTTYTHIPQKFEAGTPAIAQAIALGVAVDVIEDWGIENMHKHTLALRNYLKDQLKTMLSCQIFEFEAEDYAGALSFNIKGTHPSDVGSLLDKYAVAVRAGHHCTQPLMDLLKIPGTVRASLAPYNTAQEVDQFLGFLRKVEGFFS